MKLSRAISAAGLSFFLTSLSLAPAFASRAGGSNVRADERFKKVLVLVFENANYSDAMKQPAFSKLAEEGALLTDFHGVTHPSQPNYIAMTAGSVHGVTDNGKVDLDVRHIGDLLEARKKTWKAYLEDYPGNCFTDEERKQYVRKHNPFISFTNVRTSPRRCANLVPAAALQQDIESDTLPHFSLYVPDLKNDGHDTGVEYAARWFSTTFLPNLKGKENRLPKDLLLVVTFDEGTGRDNRIFTAFLGAEVKPGASSNKRYDHYSLLRTIENQFRLGTLGLNDEKASPIDDVWRH